MSALLCLALNIYFEARSEEKYGVMAMAAPAMVVLNRVKDPRYPDDVCEVVKQAKKIRNGFPRRQLCQCSWYCDGKHDQPLKGSMWKESQEVAKYVLTTLDLMDITDGATHYHADYIASPRWAHPSRKTVEIDTHIFFNNGKKKARKI